MIGAILLGALVILAVYLFTDIRRLPGRLSLHKQTSVEPTYQEIDVRMQNALLNDVGRGSETE